MEHPLPLSTLRTFFLRSRSDASTFMACRTTVLASIAFCLLCLYVTLLFHRYHPALVSDEIFHHDQIMRFLRGSATMNPSLTTIPGYHAIIAAMSWAMWHIAMIIQRLTTLPIGNRDTWQSIGFLRLCSAGINMAAVASFWWTARSIDKSSSLIRTAQFAFLPLLFPLFFLLYTDIAAILFVLLAVRAVMAKQYQWAGISAVFSILMRQNSIVWFGWLFAWSMLRILSETHILVPLATRHTYKLQLEPRRIWRTLRVLIIKLWPFIAGSLAFAAFVKFNHGIAIGDSGAHPFPAFHTGNIFFGLFLVSLLYLPLWPTQVPGLLQKLRSPLVLASLAALIVLYWLTFHNTHPYNQAWMQFWLRNRALVYFSTSTLHRLFLLLSVCIGALWLSLQKTRLLPLWMLGILTVIYLLPSWLIEQRYLLLPLSLFLLLRKQASARLEKAIVVTWMILDIVLCIGILQGKFFL